MIKDQLVYVMFEGRKRLGRFIEYEFPNGRLKIMVDGGQEMYAEMVMLPTAQDIAKMFPGMIPNPHAEEITKLNEALDELVAMMRTRLEEQAKKGYRGWDNPTSLKHIEELFTKNKTREFNDMIEVDHIDLANLVMFRWYLASRGARAT